MRVVHIIKVVRIAGAEQHLLTLLAGLRHRQIDARLLLLVEPDNDMGDYADKLEAQHLPVQPIVIHHHADIALLSRLRRELRVLQPDIVHTHLIHADLYGILAARWAGVPVIISSRHNDDAFRYRLPVKVVNRMLWRMVSAGIAISDSIARFSMDIEGAPKRVIHRIYYGLDADVKPLDRNAARNTLLQERALESIWKALTPQSPLPQGEGEKNTSPSSKNSLSDTLLPPQAVMIGMVCRLVEQKGVRYGLDAFIQIAPAFSQAHLLIAGEGPLQAELEDRAKQAGLMNRVHFLGWRADVPALLAGLDILLAPSLWEGFGLVMLEAMAQQTAVIASRVSAIPEVVSDGETGLLVAPRDVPALTDALRQLLTDVPLRQHMGLLGRDRMETHFSAAHMVDETAALYHRLLDGSKREI